MKTTRTDAYSNRQESLSTHTEAIASSQYPLVVSLWVLFLSLVLMANPG
ncbi:MAG: hypothetical protein KDI05_02365 [Halieaceae bacterium]|nr:hypothetical protein [Halieaceae bacterium]MCP5204162.1 hypothetical protein [Pseudomonadales bacterium]